MIKTEQICSKLIKILEDIPSQNNIRVHGCYKLTVPVNWKNTLQINNDHHILYIHDGEGSYHFGNNTVSLYKGRLVFVSKGCRHYARNNVKNPLSITGLRFDLYKSNLQTAEFNIAPFYAVPETINIIKYDMIFTDIYNAFYSNIYKNVSVSLCSSLIYTILYDILISLTQNQKNPSLKIKLDSVRNMLNTDISNSLDVSHMAKTINISERYFRKIFKKQYGLSPKEFQISVRMNHARFFLETTDRNIKEIADLLGYSDQYAFSRQYKKYWGYSPSVKRMK
jgi:AraC family transcriptional regulator, transcriptional activator for feuABC-ybbA operon